jgi:hypothetical protein
MAGSTRGEIRRLGVIGMAAVLSRYDEITKADFERNAELYSFLISIIRDDGLVMVSFYECLCHNQNRSNAFNEFLIERLTKQLQVLLVEPNGQTEYGLVESERCLDFVSFVSREPTRSAHSLRTQRHRSDIRNAVLVFSGSGLRLLFEATVSIGRDLRDHCGYLFEISLQLNCEALSHEDSVTILLHAHSFIMSLLNFFSGTVDENILARIGHLMEIERRIVSELGGIEQYVHPFYEEMFPRHRARLKRWKDSSDLTMLFMQKFRNFFAPPMPTLFNVLVNCSVPLSLEDHRMVLRLLLEYRYILAPNKPLFECSPYHSLDILRFLSAELLPSVLEVDTESAVSICEQIFQVLRMQISLSHYRDKLRFEQMLQALCQTDNRGLAFKYFAKMMKDELPQEIKLSLLLFLRALMHSGPSCKWDIEGREYKRMAHVSRKLLTSHSPVLEKSGVKSVLPLFFEYNTSILDEVSLFITTTFSVDILAGGKCEQWPSVVPETFVLFFNQCMVILNSRLAEIKRKISLSSFVLSEEAVATIMNRLNKIAALMKGLLLHTCSPAIPTNVLRCVLKQGVAWTDTSILLFSFLNDAKECEPASVGNFLDFSRSIKRQLQIIVDHVRRNEKSLQALLPSVSKSLASWSYSMRNVLRTNHDEAIQIEAFRERTLLGDMVTQEAGSEPQDA